VTQPPPGLFFFELVLRESVMNWLKISQTALPSFKPELFLSFLPPKGLVTVITHLLGQDFVGLRKDMHRSSLKSITTLSSFTGLLTEHTNKIL